MIPRVLVFFSSAWLAVSAGAAVLVPPNSVWQFEKGWAEASIPDIGAWRQLGFNDAGWALGQAPFYYENQPGSANASTGNTKLTDMFGNYTCVFLRRTFVLNNPWDVAALQVAGHSDDGFIAWINGQEVGRFNMPDGEIRYSATSRGALPEPVPWWTNIVENAQAFLLPGSNVLAIQAFNSGKGNSSDFSISPALYFTLQTEGPSISLVYPQPGSAVRGLVAVEVAFNRPVTGVDPTDLLINGQPAQDLVTVTPSQYVFTFAEPPAGLVQVRWASAHGIRDLSTAGNAFAGGNWNYNLDPAAPVQGLQITEFMASNSGDQPNSVKDEFGASPDWIELHNRSSQPVNLTGWCLSDNPSRLNKWRFPAMLIPANGYLVVLASDRNTNVAGKLHTNFKLSADPGYLALSDPALNVVSAFASYPAQFTDVSYGRDPVETDVTGYYLTPTPGAANTVAGTGFAPAVQFSRAGGTFLNEFYLQLSTADTNCDIRFELVTANVPSGSSALTNIPTQASALYTGPILINNTLQVRARTFPRSGGLFPGPPRTESYVRLTPSAAIFTSDLPLILLHNLSGGSVPQTVDQNVIAMVFEPINGRSSLTNPPTLVTRAGFNIRGSSTAGNPQSSFALEFWDEFNEDKKASLLGLPAESDWVLFGQNGFDPSFLHNPLMHQLSRDLGRYSSRTRFAEVFLNVAGGSIAYVAPGGGHYYGIYTIEEKVKRDADRVDIEKLEPGQNVAPEVTGGYLMKIDRMDSDERAFSDGHSQQIIYQDPPGLEMVTPGRQAQAAYISSYFSQFGTALWGPNYTNPATGYAAYIDVPSWLDHHLLNALAFNVDAFRLSGFFYKNRGEKISMGPLWDFDRSLGTSGGDLRPFNPRLWRVQASGDQGTDFFGNPSLLGVRWWQRLFTAPDFWQQWIDRWAELRGNVFSTNHLFARVDELGAQLQPAQPRQSARWSGSRPRVGSVLANGYSHVFNGTYQGELTFLKRWLSDRVHFIDTNFLRAPLFSAPGGPIASGFSLTLTAPSQPANTRIYYTLDGSDPRLSGGAISPAARSAIGQVTLSLTNNARVFARSHNLNHANLTNWPGSVGGNPPISSPWSAPTVGTFVVSTPTLAITEIMYNPAAPVAGTNDNDDFEFIEIKNVGSRAISLPGVQLSGGVNYTFSAASLVTNLGAGQYCVLVRDGTAFASRYPSVTNVAGVFARNLANSGESLRLAGPLQESILDFGFSDTWQPVTDGAGFSLVLRNENGPAPAGSDPTAWRASTEVHGSPGRADPAPSFIPPVQIQEVLTHTDPPFMDTVEVFNPTASPVPLEGWFLTDDSDQPRKFQIPPNKTVPANGLLLLTENDFNSGAPGSFAFSSLGEAVYLFSGDGTNLTGYRHGFEFGAQLNGVTFGRVTSSDGREHFVTEQTPTLGSANAGPKIGPVILNEIMYAPPPFGLNANRLGEFVELKNITAQPAPLFDPAHPTNTWRLGGGVEYTFPPGVVLEPGALLVVVGFDPAYDPVALNWFRSYYQVASDVSIYGPFEGNLANEGEMLALYLPDKPELPSSPNPGFVPSVLVEAVDYSRQPPWPADTLGTGNSLGRIGPVFANDPIHWQAGAGSPGRPNQGMVGQDTDEDGMPDDWELANGLDPQNSSEAHGALGDLDQDGATNLHEYQAGTRPNDATDLLRFEMVTLNTGYCVFDFNVRSGRIYTVERLVEAGTTNWLPLVENITGNDTTFRVRDPLNQPGQSSRYYRVKVQLE